MFRVIGGSLSTIMSTDFQSNSIGPLKDETRTFVVVFHAFLDGIRRFPKYSSPNLGVDGHESREEFNLPLWGL